ncbi:YraN family protein [Jatrophihabitans sp. YIM 134969]
MRAKDETGRWGEAVAARYLTAAGLEILDRNWRCELGELDIVAREGPALVFCEVKTRSSTAFGDPAEAVGFHKSRRIHHLAGRYLAEHPETRAPDLRFDIVAVLRPSLGAPTLRHLRGAF